MSKRDFLVSVRKAVKSGASTKYLDPSVVEMLGTISTESLASRCRISPVQFKKQRVLFLAGLEDEDGNLTEEGKKWCEVDACPYTARKTVRWYPEAVERIKSYS